MSNPNHIQGDCAICGTTTSIRFRRGLCNNHYDRARKVEKAAEQAGTAITWAECIEQIRRADVKRRLVSAATRANSSGNFSDAEKAELKDALEILEDDGEEVKVKIVKIVREHDENEDESELDVAEGVFTFALDNMGDELLKELRDFAIENL